MRDRVNVSPEKALIFRILHKDNFPGVLDHGAICRNNAINIDGYVQIGDPDLISKRTLWPVPMPPWGMLSDYVPFYFTYASPMLFKIKTGHGVKRCHNSEIVFLVTSLRRLKELGIAFVFTDRHSYLKAARFSNDLTNLADWIDWGLLQRKDFKRDMEDPRKVERYQAEALVYKVLPAYGLLGAVCYNQQVEAELAQAIAVRGLDLPVLVRPGWYF